MKRFNPWAWLIFLLGFIYFFLPLFATFEFSLRMLKDQYSFEAYRVAFQDPRFYSSFGYSLLWAALTIALQLAAGRYDRLLGSLAHPPIATGG